MVKIHFFALVFAAQISLFSIDRAVAMDTSVNQPGVFSSGTEPVGVIPKNHSTLYKQTNASEPSARPSSFSAHYRRQHQPSETVLDEALVLYSEAGIRVEQLIGQSANIYIANYADEKFWFIDRSRQVFHAIPVVMTQHQAQPVEHSNLQPATGFIQLSPCSGLEGQSEGIALWQGRTVQHWACLKHGELVEEQWYAPNPGVVVRSLTSDGYVSELTDLRDRDISSLSFRPPSHYRQVSIEELMNPSIPIGTYIE